MATNNELAPGQEVVITKASSQFFKRKCRILGYDKPKDEWAVEIALKAGVRCFMYKAQWLEKHPWPPEPLIVTSSGGIAVKKSAEGCKHEWLSRDRQTYGYRGRWCTLCGAKEISH